MGWSRLLLAGAMFPSGAGAEENHVPQLLVVKGPYRYVRNPIYILDVGVIFGTALLTSNWWLVILTVAYVIQLRTQVHAEERELKARFGATYDRYCRQVPRFIPRLRPVDPAGVYRSPELAFTLVKGAVPLRRVHTFKRTVYQRAVYERIYENSTGAHETPDAGDMSTRAATPLAWSIWVFSAFLGATALVITFLGVSAGLSFLEFGAAFNAAVIAASFSTVGAMVVSRRPKNPIGWIMCAGCLGVALGSLTDAYAIHVLFGCLNEPMPGATLSAWVSL